jgi:LmbE family N-acetylglucosaminyl deacetylase
VALAAGANAQGRVQHAASDPTRRVEWLVVAPHPDDATLIAAGVIARAVRDDVGVAVAFVTNGDLTCARDGAVRELESVQALAELGLDEGHLFFLGYPDGYLARLGRAPLPPVERRIDGACVHGDRTYALHGYEGRDVHSAWFGASAEYTADNAVTDLAALLATLRPRQIVVTHPMDSHPDHAATYALVRRALARAGLEATLHRALVHTGSCWPLGPEAAEPCSPTVIDPSAAFPPLLGALHDYVFTERIPVPEDLLSADVDANPKLRAIRRFHSQLGPSPLQSYLFTFSRREEPFFVEPADPWGAATYPRRREPLVDVMLSSSSPRHELRQELPLGVELDWPRSAPAVEVLADDGGAYQLAYDARAQAAVLNRVDRGQVRTVKEWPLPHDLWASGEREHIQLRFEPRPRDGDIAEVAFFVRGELVGVAVDLHPRHSGESVRAALATGQPPLELSVTSSAPSLRPVQVVHAPRGTTATGG